MVDGKENYKFDLGVKRLTVIVLYSVQEYKWVAGNCKGNLMKCVGEGGGGRTNEGLASSGGEVLILLII